MRSSSSTTRMRRSSCSVRRFAVSRPRRPPCRPPDSADNAIAPRPIGVVRPGRTASARTAVPVAEGGFATLEGCPTRSTTGGPGRGRPRTDPLDPAPSAGWAIDAYALSLGQRSPATARAYLADVEAFAGWAGRGGVAGPPAVDRLLLRRYLAYLSTRRYARSTIARKAAALRSYFRWCGRRGLTQEDPARRLWAPGSGGRLPRVLSHAELASLLDRPAGPTPAPADRPASPGPWPCGTTPSSSSSTPLACGWPSCAGSSARGWTSSGAR